MLNLFLYILFTMFLIWVVQKMKLFDYIFVGKFLTEMRKCPKCIGYWVAYGFYFVFGQKTFIEIKWIDAALVALLIDFLTYYLTEGIIRNHVTVRL